MTQMTAHAVCAMAKGMKQQLAGLLCHEKQSVQKAVMQDGARLLTV